MLEAPFMSQLELIPVDCDKWGKCEGLSYQCNAVAHSPSNLEIPR